MTGAKTVDGSARQGETPELRMHSDYWIEPDQTEVVAELITGVNT